MARPAVALSNMVLELSRTQFDFVVIDALTEGFGECGDDIVDRLGADGQAQ
jgi:hypothetical protein